MMGSYYKQPSAISSIDEGSKMILSYHKENRGNEAAKNSRKTVTEFTELT